MNFFGQNLPATTVTVYVITRWVVSTKCQLMLKYFRYNACSTIANTVWAKLTRFEMRTVFHTSLLKYYICKTPRITDKEILLMMWLSRIEQISYFNRPFSWIQFFYVNKEMGIFLVTISVYPPLYVITHKIKKNQISNVHNALYLASSYHGNDLISRIT